MARHPKLWNGLRQTRRLPSGITRRHSTNKARSRAGSRGTVHSSRMQAEVRSSHRLADSKRKELGTPSDRRACTSDASSRSFRPL